MEVNQSPPPCFFTFEQCKPEDVIYRLSYKNCKESSDYMQLFSDYGWEYCCQCTGWLYFRKPASQIDTESESELFSESESKIQMLLDVVKTRLMPAFLIVGLQFANILLRNNQIEGPSALLSLILFCAIGLLVRISIKLSKLKRKYKADA